MTRRNFLKDTANTIRSDIRKGFKSTNDTINILRKSDSVMDAITSPSIWTKVKRELFYVAAVSWQLPAILALYMVCFWIIGSIIF